MNVLDVGTHAKENTLSELQFCDDRFYLFLVTKPNGYG